MTIEIRFAEKEDAEVIAAFSRQTFYDTFAIHNTKENMGKFMNEQFSQAALMLEVEDKANIFLVAFVENEMAGYVKLREGESLPELENKPAIEIARIYADNKSIGKGIGSALMRRSIELAKENNKEVIWLGVWDKNQLAIDFYKKWGFEIFSKHPFLLGDDLQTDWLMKKEL